MLAVWDFPSIPVIIPVAVSRIPVRCASRAASVCSLLRCGRRWFASSGIQAEKVRECYNETTVGFMAR